MPQNPTDPNWGLPEPAVSNPTDPNWGATPDAPKGRDFKVLGVNIHVPPEREKPRLDSNVLGWGTDGAGVAPEDVLMAGQAVRGVSAAGKAGGVLAGVKQAVAEADPIVKFEVIRRSLKAAGVSDEMASLAAAGLTGFRRGRKPSDAPERIPSAPESPHLDLSQRVRAGGLTQEQIGERIAAARAQGMTAPDVAPRVSPRPMPSDVPAMPPKTGPVAVPPPVKPTVSPARVANDLGIAARRAGVQLTAADDAAVLERISRGADPAQAIAEVIAAKADPAAELARRLGTPADAEMTFGLNKSGLPTKAPTATKARGKVADLAEMPIGEAPKVEYSSADPRAKPASWVFIDKKTGKAVMETYDESKVAKLNTAKYKAVPILEYLQSLNKK